jgi:hypothetical protein
MRPHPGLLHTVIAATLLAVILSPGVHGQQPGKGSPAQAARQAAARAQLEREQALHDQFFQSQGAHFTVLFEGQEDSILARHALDILEEGYSRVGQALNTFPTRNVVVVLYTEQQFRDITRAPDWAAGAYDGKIRIPLRGALAKPDELTRVLVHELTHAMLHATVTRGLPAWLNEGLAVNFEPRGVTWAEQELATATDQLPFSRLTRSFTNLSGDAARIAYAQSAVLTHRLLEEAGGTTLNIVLQDLNAGQPFEAAFEQRFLTSFEHYTGSLTPER